MSRIITLIGARGGQGTSTTAAALASSLAIDSPVSLLAHDPLCMASLLGSPPPMPSSAPVEVSPGLALSGLDGPRRPVTVIDAGTAASDYLDEEGERYAVVRGPCYLALATLISLPDLHLDGVVLIVEPGRALDAQDVAAVLDVPVVSTIPFTPEVSRSIDAGLLAIKVPRVNAFRSLEDWARRPPPPEPARDPERESPAVDRPASLAVGRSHGRSNDHGLEVAP
jgi:hypothetical protein